jgi:predicted ATPase/DNA-binding CsgD family transcriptional regulator
MTHNLPLQQTTFIGRKPQIVQLQGLLADVHLLTLTGPGGVGKTRLALQVAGSVVDQYADGVWLVDLAPLADEHLVPQAVASTLGIPDMPEESLIDTVARALESKCLLLVLDNCEHLLGACQILAHRLLRSCAAVRMLATSRQSLDIPGETAWRVPSLDLPPIGDGCAVQEMGRYEALNLFCERAQATLRTFAVADADWPVVADICRRLDGIPLAIELAAARTAVLSVHGIADRLDDLFHVLTTGSRMAPNRQQTLRATIDWSFDLLSRREQQLFEGLSTFSGGWTIEAAEVVCASGDIASDDVLDLLMQLADKSLVLVERGVADVARYRLLEVLRQYGQERLRQRADDTPARRHADYFLWLAERAESKLVNAGQRAWLEQLDLEHDNLRTAGRDFLNRRDSSGAERLFGALRNFWFYRGHLSEGRAWLAETLSLVADTGESQAAATQAEMRSRRAKVLHAGAILAFAQSDYPAAQSMAESELDLRLRDGDDSATASALLALGFVAKCRGDLLGARHHLEESVGVSSRTGDNVILALGLASLAEVAYDDGAYKLARTTAEKALGIARQAEFPTATAESLLTLGNVSYQCGDYVSAQRLLELSLAIARELGRKSSIALALASLSHVFAAQHKRALSVSVLQESLVLAREIGDRLGVARALEGFVQVAAASGEPRLALLLVGAAQGLRDLLGAPPNANARALLERALASTETLLDASARATARTEGQALPVDHVIAMALAWVTSASASPGSGRDGALTRRERQVAALAARGWKNRDIAQELVITEKTAKNHVAHILAKLGLESRTRLAALARDEDWDLAP